MRKVISLLMALVLSLGLLTGCSRGKSDEPVSSSGDLQSGPAASSGDLAAN